MNEKEMKIIRTLCAWFTILILLGAVFFFALFICEIVLYELHLEYLVAAFSCALGYVVMYYITKYYTILLKGVSHGSSKN